MYEEANEGMKYTHALILKRAAMKPINGLKAHYVSHITAVIKIIVLNFSLSIQF